MFQQTHHPNMAVNCEQPLVRRIFMKLGCDKFLCTKYYAIFTPQSDSSPEIKRKSSDGPDTNMTTTYPLFSTALAAYSI